MKLHTKDYPDHHDAELVLQLYDLRREPAMRAARDLISRDFWPASAAEAVAVLAYDHPLNTAYRQVSTYWEMAYGMARQGVIHPDFLIESNGHEGLLLFAKVEPYLAELRAAANSPRVMLSAEWIARESTAGQEFVARLRGRVRATLAQRAGTA